MRLELFVEDVKASAAFYSEVLGFTIVHQNAQSGYSSLTLGDSRIALQNRSALEPSHPLAQSGKKGLGVEIVLEVDDIAGTYASVKARYAAVTELIRQPWGLTDFRVIDPDGYYLRLTSKRKA